MINQLICGDCIDILKQISDETVDLLITDPPYFVSKENGDIRITGRKDISLDYGEWDRQWNNTDEYFAWCEEWFKECVRVLKNGSWLYIFFGKRFLWYLQGVLFPKYGIEYKNILVWCKSNPAPSFRKANWLNATEFILVGAKGDSRIKHFTSQKDMINYFIHSNGSSYKETEHPTEKPINILKKLILTSSDEGDLVLDPFAGSGSTAIACIKTGRNYFCIEKDENYYSIAKERIEKETKNLNLFSTKTAIKQQLFTTISSF